MKQVTFGIAILLLLVSITSAQKPVDKATSVSAISDSSAAVSVAPGTYVAGRLQNSLDVKKAKVGDEVVLKTTSAVKQNGKAVIAKGSTLVGRVTEVQKKVKGNANSSIGIVFQQLQQGGRSLPINAVITSVIQANSAATMSSDDLFASGSTSTRSTTAASTSGGLLGGVTNTVGGVANATTQTLGGVTDIVAGTAAATTGVVSGSLRGLSISQSTGASAQGGSTLNMAGKDLRLEKGTTFNLAISSSTSVEKK